MMIGELVDLISGIAMRETGSNATDVLGREQAKNATSIAYARIIARLTAEAEILYLAG